MAKKNPVILSKKTAQSAVNKTVFSQLHGWGIANEPVDEGKTLQQKLAFRAELAENTKLTKNSALSAVK